MTKQFSSLQRAFIFHSSLSGFLFKAFTQIFISPSTRILYNISILVKSRAQRKVAVYAFPNWGFFVQAFKFKIFPLSSQGTIAKKVKSFNKAASTFNFTTSLEGFVHMTFSLSLGTLFVFNKRICFDILCDRALIKFNGCYYIYLCFLMFHSFPQIPYTFECESNLYCALLFNLFQGNSFKT